MSDGTLAHGNGSERTRGGDWRKSSYSLANTNCVEAARLADGHVAVRDSQAAGGLVLRVRPQAWMAFTARLRQRLQANRNLEGPSAYGGGPSAICTETCAQISGDFFCKK
jgi:hypothetical protein